MRLIIMCSTAALSYHLRLLSSLIRVTVGGPTSSFVEGHIAGSFWTGLPPGGDPFVHHGVTLTEDKHELELSASLFSPRPFSSPSRSFLCSSLTILFLLVHPQALTWSKLEVKRYYKNWASATGGSDIRMESHHSLSDISELKLSDLKSPASESGHQPASGHHDWEDGGPELIVQTQFLRLPLWNQELWMDITPLTSENQRGTDDHQERDRTQWLCGWETLKDKQGEGEILNKGECVFM